MSRLLVFGETTFDTIASTRRLMPVDAVTLLDQLTHSRGGRGANVSRFAAASGVPATLLSAVGADFAASGYAEVLKDAGVDLEHLFVDQDGRTSRAYVFRDGDHAATFFFGGVIDARPREVEAFVRERTTLLAPEAVYCTSGLHEANRYLLAHTSAPLRAFAPGPEAFHLDAGMLTALLGAANALFVNSAEAEYIVTTLGHEEAALPARFDLDLQVVTRGAAGSTIRQGERRFDVGVCRPARVADTTGAGDAYAGAFLATYLDLGDARRAGERAAAVASFAVEAEGCQSRVPSADEVTQRLERDRAEVRP